jgi:hypothetical protein
LAESDVTPAEDDFSSKHIKSIQEMHFNAEIVDAVEAPLANVKKSIENLSVLCREIQFSATFSKQHVSKGANPTTSPSIWTASYSGCFRLHHGIFHSSNSTMAALQEKFDIIKVFKLVEG